MCVRSCQRLFMVNIKRTSKLQDQADENGDGICPGALPAADSKCQYQADAKSEGEEDAGSQVGIVAQDRKLNIATIYDLSTAVD